MPINPDVFRFLVALFEAGSVTHTVAELKESMPNQDTEALFKLAYRPEGYSMWYPAEDGDYFEVRELEPGKFFYFDVGWYPVDPHELKLYRYRMDWLPQTLKSGLHISGDIQEIVPKKLWRLGEFRHMDRVAPIWLARRLSQGEVIDEVYDALAALEQDREGLIICHRRPPSKRFTFPGDYRLVDPINLLNEEGYLSADYIKTMIQPGASPRNDSVHWDENNGFLHVGGDVIRFSGEKRRKVISLLFERSKETSNKWNIQALLEEIGSNSTHISKLFKNHPRWKEVVMYDDGLCWLNTQPERRFSDSSVVTKI